MAEWSSYTTSAKGEQSLWTAEIISQKTQSTRRGSILGVKKKGAPSSISSVRAIIAREIGCAPSTAANELRRGTPPRKSSKGM